MKHLHTQTRIALFLLAVVLVQKINAQGFAVTVITTATPPVTPVFSSAYFAGGKGIGSTMIFQKDDPTLFNDPYKFTIVGKLERLPPSPFSIEFNTSFLNPQFPPSFTSSKPPNSHLLSATDFQAAFGNFNEKFLIFKGISPNEIIQSNNVFRLPDGLYRVCFSVFGLLKQGGFKQVSAPGSGCATFTICSRAQAAPQFIQPVNNLNITSSIAIVRPISPVVFTWTPPQSFCGSPRGGYKYDFEIHEMLDNQAVTDAINNPFVFQKRDLPSTTFLLDTNLYKGVLQQGKRYAIRVKANNASLLDTFSIDNNGYSRVEAFQYGNSPDLVVTPVTSYPVQPPQYYYIPFGERQTLRWNDVYTAYLNGRHRDTVVPLKEYIALNLIQDGIAYNLDAIELFMALNPQLAGLTEVKLSNKAKLPDFPPVSGTERQDFETRHAENLTPDPQENARFSRLVDSLNQGGFSQRLTDATALLIKNLTAETNGFGRTVQNVNRVTVNLLNQLLVELLYDLRQQTRDANSSDAHIRDVAADIRELIADVPNTTSYRFQKPQQLSSLSAISLPLHLLTPPVSEGTLLPVDVVVWKGANEPPARPVSSAPELRRTYRVFYTTTALYNNKNPEVNVKVLPTLASTSQASLPKLGRFKFWTQNLKTKNETRAVDVETSDVFMLNKKNNWPGTKRLFVVLKVE